MKFANLLFVVFVLGLSAFETANANDQDGKNPSISPKFATIAAKDLRNRSPQKGEMHTVFDKDGVYISMGNLFHDARSYAAVFDDGRVIICQWRKNEWKPLSVWNADYGLEPHEAEATQPFWLFLLQDHPLLVIPTDETKGQNYEAWLLDDNCGRILAKESSFDMQPVVKYNYLVTADASRGKGEWQATFFSKTLNGKFVDIASWEQYLPWHAESVEEGDPILCFRASGKLYSIEYDESKSPQTASVTIFSWDPKIGGAQEIRESGEKCKLFAKINFVQRKGSSFDPEQPQMELAYIFEKLTGVPHGLYNIRDNIELKQIESIASIKVTGSKEAIKLLSPGPSR